MNRLTIKPSVAGTSAAMLCNFALAYAAYMLCRVVFVAANWGTYSEGFAALSFWELLKGSLLFDTSAILYTNALYAVLMLLPLHYKELRAWQCVAKWLFVVVNALAVTVNLADAVYFAYTGHRTTTSVFSEFSNEGNLAGIFLQSAMQSWYVVVVGVVIIYGLARCYVSPQRYVPGSAWWARIGYYAVQALCLAAFVPLFIGGARGGFTTAVRPITISNANQYVNRPLEAAIVLNTPFSLIRTIGKDVFHDPGYFTPQQLDGIYSPLHNTLATPDSIGGEREETPMRSKNVVVLIVESFGREYIGAYNDRLAGETAYQGYTPFVNTLTGESLTFDYTFANGRQSIDGMPSILSAIPRFDQPFVLTPASMNDVSGLAGELRKCGYSSAFFHGAENGSMGFEAFAKTTGYQRYYGRTEFNEDKRFRGDEDFDGMWAIWDEPFLQFYALKMTELREPFITTVFTASSHHPYNIPEKYDNEFNLKGEEANPIHKCIRYTDMALRKFFETARRQPWFANTIFVLTADHTNILDHKEYSTDLGIYCVPILFYDPSGEMPRGRRHCIAQQTDIMPTVLQYLGYDKPYVAFGCDLLNTPDEDTWAVNHNNGIYQFARGSHVIQFDGTRTTAMYNYKSDWFMRRNLASEPEMQDSLRAMETTLKGIIQSYMQRMTKNNLVYRE